MKTPLSKTLQRRSTIALIITAMVLVFLLFSFKITAANNYSLAVKAGVAEVSFGPVIN